MTEQEIVELVKDMRQRASGAWVGTRFVEDLLQEGADIIEAQQATIALCERRADEAEARNVFLLTELERILKEAGK